MRAVGCPAEIGTNGCEVVAGLGGFPHDRARIVALPGASQRPEIGGTRARTAEGEHLAVRVIENLAHRLNLVGRQAGASHRDMAIVEASRARSLLHPGAGGPEIARA